MTRYHAAWWLLGAHAQTLWGKLVRREPEQPTARERWITPDGDFLDIHRLTGASNKPRLLVLHGLEGTIRSQYAQKLLGEARKRGWSADMLIFRSCSPEMNLTRRFYHSGETSDLRFVIDRIVEENPHQPLLLAGVSLGGNVLLKYPKSKLLPQYQFRSIWRAPRTTLTEASRVFIRGILSSHSNKKL